MLSHPVYLVPPPPVAIGSPSINQQVHQVLPSSRILQKGVSQSGGAWRICLATGVFIEFLRRALNDTQVLEECARRHHLPFPGTLGEDGHLVRAISDDEGAPITMTVRVADYIASSSKYGHGQLADWELYTLELSMDADFVTKPKPYRFDPPANDNNPEAERNWWVVALAGLPGLISSVQQAHFAKAVTVTARTWEELPLVIWAKPFSRQQQTTVDSTARRGNKGAGRQPHGNYHQDVAAGRPRLPNTRGTGRGSATVGWAQAGQGTGWREPVQATRAYRSTEGAGPLEPGRNVGNLMGWHGAGSGDNPWGSGWEEGGGYWPEHTGR